MNIKVRGLLAPRFLTILVGGASLSVAQCSAGGGDANGSSGAGSQSAGTSTTNGTGSSATGSTSSGTAAGDATGSSTNTGSTESNGTSNVSVGGVAAPGGTFLAIGDVTDVENPCDGADAPETCELQAASPACGDGELNQDGEACDDGNSLPGDGCSGRCVVEPYSSCPTPGQACVSTIVCGDGVIGPGEACDDGNDADGDGCAGECNLVESGYACRTAGEECLRVYLCGDGQVDPNEGCDDGGVEAEDGCSPTCRIETGFKCEGNPSDCSPTECGDGEVEGAESCDDRNTIPFDGCGADCRAEPDCSAGACESSCGDGIVLGEDCDDGNLRDGDGCSSSCTVEDGYDCSNDVPCTLVGDLCTLTVPAVFRDFEETHVDFEPNTENHAVIPGLVEDRLADDDKPVFAGPDGTGNIASALTFNDWYHDTNSNTTVARSLTLYENAAGDFVNRWGDNGEQWQLGGEPDQATLRWGGPAGSACSEAICADAAECFDPCTPWDQPENSCCGDRVPIRTFDGDPVFFPIDDIGTLTSIATIAAPYSGAPDTWINEPGGAMHNFYFTSEVRFWFEYDPDTPATLAFLGDDDVWVFVNGRLALDLGGWHSPEAGELTVGPATAAGFGLSAGSVYKMDVFHAERKINGSSFQLTLSGFNMSPTLCTTDCGDGALAPGEECDDGPGNLGGYNECTPSCTFGPRCGDTIIQDQFDEVCDDGVNDGSYGNCSPTCQLGPHCGDGVVQPEFEACDDGINSGGYGECAPGCVIGPLCGDGIHHLDYEDCDDGNNESGDGCSSACVFEVLLK